MDEKITLEIRTRLDQLFSSYPASRELTELKEELVADLTEAVTEKVNDGTPATTAVDEAMGQLGDIDSLLREVAGEHAADQKHPTTPDEDQADTDDADTSDDVRIGGKNGLRIHGDKVIWRGKTIVDNDQVHLGNLVQVDGDHVRVAGGLVDVQGDNVNIAGEPAERTFVESLKLTNTRTFDSDGVTDLVIAYPDAAVKISPISGDQIIVNEYMSRHNPRYFLKADRHGETLTIRQGDRPRLWSLHIRAEILLPASLVGKLTVKTGNGSLELNDLAQKLAVSAQATNGSVHLFNDALASLDLHAANGSLKVTQVTAEQLTLASQNGSVHVMQSQGRLTVSSHNGSVRVTDFTGDGELSSHNGSVKVTDYTGQLSGETANGSLRVRGLAGGGSFHSHHGSFELDVVALTGDLRVIGAGNVKLQLADTVAYRFDLAARRGTVRLPQRVQLTLNDEHHKMGVVGETPAQQLFVATDNGNVTVK